MRVGDGKWFGGVAVGLARRWGVDPLIVRAGFLLLTVLFGIGIPAYIVAWSVLPDERDEIAAEKAIRDGDLPSIILCLAAIVVTLSGFGVFWSFGHGWGVGGPAIGLAVLAWAFVAWNGHGPGARLPQESSSEWTERLAEQARQGVAPTQPAPAQSPGNRAAAAGAAAREGGVDLRKHPYDGPAAPAIPTRPPKRRRLGAAVSFAILGISVLAGAFTALALVGTSHGDSALQVGLAAGAAVAAVALIIGGLAGRRGGALGPLATLAVIAAVLTSVSVPTGMPWTGTIGENNWQPTSVAPGTQHNFAMRIGEGNLDLSGVNTAELPAHTHLNARVNIGQLTITAPAGTTVHVNGYAHMGQIETTRGGNQISAHGGIDSRRTITVGTGTKVIDITATVGMGNITVKESK